MRPLLLILLLAPVLGDAQTDSPASLLLAVRTKVMQTVNNLPKYLCTETIDRSRFSSRKSMSDTAKILSSDRLRLDVATSGETEMYSWVAEDRFRDQSLAELVHGGATSTGAFATILGSIFGTSDATFTFNGESERNGTIFSKFAFDVKQERSGYTIGNQTYRAAVPYDGTFLVNPKTFDLVQLVVRAHQLPSQLHACQDTTTLRYHTVRLNNSDFLLPESALLQVEYTDGSELANRTTFSGCHEFHGESSLSFDDAQQAGSSATSSETGLFILPAGRSFAIKITQAIDTAGAAIGDPLKAELVSDLRGSRRLVLIPKGAQVRARIVGFERRYLSDMQSLRVGIKVETVEVGGKMQPFNAVLESSVVESSRTRGSGLTNLGSFDQMQQTQSSNIGVLLFEGVTKDFIIPSGTVLAGKTVSANNLN